MDEYIFTNAGHNNPLHRVIPTAFVGQTQHNDYDKEKYCDHDVFYRRPFK
jgi:hypothetical protein